MGLPGPKGAFVGIGSKRAGGRRLIVAMALSVLAALVAAETSKAVSIAEFRLPIANSGPLGIAPGGDGNVWFTENRGHRFGRITPVGKIDDFSTGSGISADALPAQMTVGPDGNLWFTEEAPSRIARLKVTGPGGPQATEFTAGITPGAQPEGITSGPDGNLWFTEFSGSRIGRISTSGVVKEFGAGLSPGSMPLGIAAGPGNFLWFTTLRFPNNPVVRMDLLGTPAEFTQGITPDSEPARIIRGPDDNMWFSEQTQNTIGRITESGIVTEFSKGISPGAGPVGLTVGPDGNIWFAEYGGSSGRRIGRITPTGVVTEFSAGITAAPIEITLGPDGNLWFTEEFGNAIGRVRLDPDVTTGAVGGVASSRATLTGIVDTIGSATSYTFEYGRSAAYGSATAPRTLTAGGNPVSVSAALAGLRPNTLYHYRLVATNRQGTIQGSDRTFTTTPGAVVVGGGNPGSQDRTGPRMAVVSHGLILTRSGRVNVSLRCPLSEPLGCHGSVTLLTTMAHKRLQLGRANFRIPGGQTRMVTVRVTKRGRSLVRARRRLTVSVVVIGIDTFGNQKRTTLRRTLKNH
jgi:streptogramin lyase